MAARYRTRRAEAGAVQFTGTNNDEVRALIPPGAGSIEVAYREQALLLSTPGHPVRIVRPGDWVTWDGTGVIVHSGDSFGRFWEPVT